MASNPPSGKATTVRCSLRWDSTSTGSPISAAIFEASSSLATPPDALVGSSAVAVRGKVQARTCSKAAHSDKATPTASQRPHRPDDQPEDNGRRLRPPTQRNGI
ncbi:hypothetical protein GCM10010182_81930 [Actinomadura cremea]|nr:hypothetical protein GCM10010182_81930 [Actinomadura cremea]